MTQEEVWKDVVGYEGLYLVSNYGRIMGIRRRMLGHILSPAKNEKGYRHVCLYKDGSAKSLKVYRVVAMAFVTNPDDLPEVDHIDGTRDNDCAWNLRWVTHKQNINTPITRGRHRECQLGDKNSFYGRHHSEKSKKMISDTKKGIIFDRPR